MRSRGFLILLVLLAGCWKEESRPNPKDAREDKVTRKGVLDPQLSLVFPENGHGTCKMTEEHLRWKDSLIKNLGHRGRSHTFLQTDLALSVRGVNQLGLVYQDDSEPARFLVIPPRPGNTVIIDRVRREIGTLGTDGVSLHPHPKGKMVVCLEPTPGTGIMGVPLSDEYKTGAPPPVFLEHCVKWSYPHALEGP